MTDFFTSSVGVKKYILKKQLLLLDFQKIQ